MRSRKPSLGEASSGYYRQHPRYRGCVGHWMMVEGGGTTLYDFSGHGATGAFAGEPRWINSRWGPGLDFDGSNDYVALGTPPSLNLPECMSAICWVKFDSVNNSGAGGLGIIGSSVTGATDRQYVILIGRQDGKITIRWSDTDLHHTTKIFAINTAYCIGWTRSGVQGSWTSTIYVNGLTESTVSGIATNPDQVQRSAFIGRRNPAGGAFNGTIESVHMYNRALSPGEILSHYQEPFLEFERRRKYYFYAPMVEAATYSQTLTAAGIFTPSLTDIITYVRTLAARAIFSNSGTGGGAFDGGVFDSGTFDTGSGGSSPTISRIVHFSRTLAVAVLFTANLSRLIQARINMAATGIFAGALNLWHFRTLAAEMIASANLSRLASLARTLAAQARFVADLVVDSTAAQEFAQAMAAVMIGAANLARQASLARTLAAETISMANIAKLLTMARTLAAETIAAVNINRTVSFFRTLAAETIGEANIARLMTLARTLAAQAQWVAAIVKDSSVAETFEQAMAAVMIGAAEINRQASLLRTMAAEAVFAASLATLSLFARTLAAVTEGVTTIARLMTLTRTLAAEAIFEPMISRLMTLFRALAVSLIGEPALTATQLFIVTAIEGFHMASQRITSFVRGRLHRKSSMTQPHTTRTVQSSRRTGARKRGDDDTDAE